MKTKFRALLAVVLILSLAVFRSALAQEVNPPADSAWNEVINSNGSIDYGSLTDNGVVTQPADFMPTIPGVGQINAEYHVYTTQSGNQVLMPTATTLFFMAADHDSALYTNLSMGTTPIGVSGAASSEGNTLVGIAALGNLFSGSLQTGGEYNETFFNSVLDGSQNIWQVGATGIMSLLGSFYTQSLQDSNLYTYMILIPPGACGSSPAGCTPEQLVVLETPPPFPTDVPTEIPPLECPPPQVIPGRISFEGRKTAPNYPLVVGQDPDKRGVDFEFSASVAPTRYITHVLVPEYDCVPSPGFSSGCGANQRRVQTGYRCEQHIETLNECIESAHGSARLSEASREWILEELSIRYPEAYLHKPEFGFGSGGDCAWSDTELEVPIADPGYWDLSVFGSTSGTPVSAPRSFGGQVDTFEAWLKEIAIIK